jgi:hypothetical protein
MTKKTLCLYYKHITIMNDTCRGISDWHHNLEHHSRVVNCNHLHSFMKFIVQASLMMTVGDCNMFIVQVTGQQRVEYLTHNPKIKGSNPTAGTGLEIATKKWFGGGGEKVLWNWQNILDYFGLPSTSIEICDLYYTYIMIINDTSRVVTEWWHNLEYLS